MSATMIAGLPPPARATTAARPRFATCSPSTGSRSPRRWRSGSAPGSASTTCSLDGQSPSRFTNGRVGRLEEQFLELTGSPLRLRDVRRSARQSWEAAREAVDAGRPALLLTDLYYLDHYGNSAHFPGHAVVLAGYDDEVAYLSDTAFDELQTTRLENLAARPPRQPPGVPARRPDADRARPGARSPTRAPPRRAAIERNARQMLEPAMGEFEGLPALRRFAAEVGEWPRAARRLAVVGALLLPGDRAPRAPAAATSGSCTRASSPRPVATRPRSPPRRRRAGRRSPATLLAASEVGGADRGGLGADRRPGGAPCSRPRSASGRRSRPIGLAPMRRVSRRRSSR